MMRTTLFGRGAIVFACLASLLNVCLAGGDDLDRIKRDIIGSWLVDVDTEKRLRTLNITGAESSPDGTWMLENTYGWTDGGQTPISAKLIVKLEGYSLLLTTQANSRIAVEFAGINVFKGSFEWSNGKIRPARLERLSAEELASRAARMSATRMQSQIKKPGPGVSAECTLWLGGWEGKWTTPGYTGNVIFWVTEVTQNGDSCNLFIQTRDGIGTPPKPLAVTDRSAAEFLCNPGTGGNCRMRIATDGNSIDINYLNFSGGSNYASLRKIAPQ